jgi:hypothetical protein
MSDFAIDVNPDDLDWESHKEMIRTLYLVENRTLEGSGGVVDEIGLKFNFWKT